MQFDFHDQVILVTGATGNLGRAVVETALGAGGQLALLDRNATRQAELYADLDREKHLAIAGIDMTEPHPVEDAVARIIERFGRIDALVHTVGGFAGGKPVHETPPEMWDAMMAQNAKTTFLICRAVVPHMLAQKRGKIVTVGAMAAKQGSARLGSYAASKAAVINLTETLSAEVSAQGINVNCVLPGTIDTPENRAAMPNADRSRWIAPEKLAAAILYLCTEDAREVHGVALAVEGVS